MSRDPWLQRVRMARAGSLSVEEVLADDVPTDGLQHAGIALLSAEHTEVVSGIARRLMLALGEREWHGDAHLIAELEHYVDRTPSDLTPLLVELDELAEALDQSAGSGSYIDVVQGTVWPAELFDFDHGPDDFDSDSDRWLRVEGLGSRSAYAVMERFVATVEHPDIASRLTDALNGPGAFRRFQTELRRYEGEFTRWHRFRDDARLGQARSWLAEQGYCSGA